LFDANVRHFFEDYKTNPIIFFKNNLQVSKINPIFTTMKIWFDSDYIYADFEDGKVLRQSLLWYPQLANASDNERNSYRIGFDGFHWEGLDTDISFESFSYEDAEPTKFQRFFLTHKELNIAEFANRININASLLRNYINGFKKPSPEREAMILEEIKRLGEEYVKVA